MWQQCGSAKTVAVEALAQKRPWICIQVTEQEFQKMGGQVHEDWKARADPVGSHRIYYIMFYPTLFQCLFWLLCPGYAVTYYMVLVYSSSNYCKFYIASRDLRRSMKSLSDAGRCVP